MALGEARRRRDVPVERRLDRRARARRGDPRPRGGSGREARLPRSDRGVHERSGRRRRDRRRRVAGARALRRGLVAGACGRRPAGDRPAHPGARSRRGAGVLRPRPGRDPVPARRLPLPALEHRDRCRAARGGAGARGAVSASVGPAPLEHLHVALTVLSPAARLRGRARGRRPARSSSPKGCTIRARSARRTSRLR